MPVKVTLQWPGGEHDFALTIGGLRAVQAACDAGPMQVYTALRTGAWRLDMPMAVLRHGLIGGGMDADEARKSIDRLFDAHPLAKFIAPAMLVIAAAVMGVDDDPVGETTGEAEMSPPESGNSPISIEAEPRPDTPPPK